MIKHLWCNGMSKIEFPLNGFWRLKGFPDLNGEEEGAYKPEYPVEDWLTAKVPGVVHMDLMDNDVIPDPFRGLNEEAVRWVEDVEWWYRREFEVDRSILEKETIEIFFEGIDTFASIWINGEKIGETNNMFTPWRFGIKEFLKEGQNTIAVQIKSAKKIAEELENKYKSKYGVFHSVFYTARPYIRKAQYSFGWDWGPRLPTAGIWRRVKIIAYDKARLGYISALPLKIMGEKAVLKLTAEVYASNKVEVEVKFKIEGYGQKIEKWVKIVAEKGRNDVECEVEVPKPRLWWPRGYGSQNLYSLTAELYVEGKLLDRDEMKIGIRSVELVQEPDEEGKTFIFKINGKPIFCKGANWIPADSFLPRVSKQRYRKLLELAAEAGMNMLRIWGGGIYEDDVFYEICDELGIMIWQDFMYACAEYPEEEWFLEEAEREAEEVVRRLRRHPCIVLWCGNNENQCMCQTTWRDRERLLGLPIYDEILPRVCSRLDPTRPYWPSSPYGGVDPNSPSEGDRHNWEVWSEWVDYPAYLRDKGRFISEFGWQAPPSLELLKEYMEPGDLYPQSRSMESHNKQVDGQERLYRFLAAHYPVPEDIKRFTLYCQLNQADALKTSIEYWRTRMFKTSGCIIWQLEDCWPVTSWSLIDYELNPKASYHIVKRIFQQIISPLIIKDGKVSVYVINETDEELRGNLRFSIMDFYGETYYSEIVPVSTSPYTSRLIIERSLNKLPLSSDRVLSVILERDGDVIYEDVKTVQEPKHLKLPKPNMKIEAIKLDVAKFKVSISSDVYTKAVWMRLDGVRARFNDNFFDILPGGSRIIKVSTEKDMSLSEFKSRLKIEAYPYN